MAEKETQVAKEAATDSKYVSRVRTKYVEEVVPYLMKRFNYKNVNQVPKLLIDDCRRFLSGASFSVFFLNVYAVYHDLVGIGDGTKNLTSFSFIFSGYYADGIILSNFHSCSPYNTSGARETIFM